MLCLVVSASSGYYHIAVLGDTSLMNNASVMKRISISNPLVYNNESASTMDVLSDVPLRLI